MHDPLGDDARRSTQSNCSSLFPVTSVGAKRVWPRGCSHVWMRLIFAKGLLLGNSQSLAKLIVQLRLPLHQLDFLASCENEAPVPPFFVLLWGREGRAIVLLRTLPNSEPLNVLSGESCAGQVPSCVGTATALQRIALPWGGGGHKPI